jgi:hypothetical protein
MLAPIITKDYIFVLSETRNILKRSIALADDWYKNLDAKLNGPAKNFLAGQFTVEQVRDRRNQLTQIRFELQNELDCLEREIY